MYLQNVNKYTLYCFGFIVVNVAFNFDNVGIVAYQFLNLIFLFIKKKKNTIDVLQDLNSNIFFVFIFCLSRWISLV
jgi:hypothetical protein